MQAQCWMINGNKWAPTRNKETDVGWDVYLPEPVEMHSGEFTTIPLGIVVKPPDGHYFELCLRSSIPKNHGLCIPNGIGVIDPEYCGDGDQVGLPIFKFGAGKLDENGVTSLRPGERIAQLVLRKAPSNIEWSVHAGAPGRTGRGGFGSSGR